MVRRGPILCVMALLSLSAVINLGFYMSVTQKISFPSSDAKGYIFTDVGQLWKYGQTVKNATANNVNSLLKYGGNVRDATAGKVHEILKQGGIADNPTVKKIYEQLLKSSRVVHHTTMNKIYDLYNQFKSKLWQEEGGNIAGKDFETDIKDEFVEMVQNLTRLDLALEDDEDEAAIENSTFSLDDIADQLNGSTRVSPVPQLEPSITDVVQPYYRLSLNIARYWNESQIVYNRVDGCGSRTLLAIIGILSYEHDYHSIWSRVWTAYNVSESRQRSLARVISKQPQPYIFNRHLYYIDFAKFGVEQLRYINLIREPLPRFMSGYNSKTSDVSKAQSIRRRVTIATKRDSRKLSKIAC
ncbi:uncharacterized protein [Ptychodera flava]|uniref:uncharacterized protein n=1 Tax=Ptychodera flava TaxID=63121 RepID=UPI00396A32BD